MLTAPNISPAGNGKLTGFLTLAAAGVATGVAGVGMWRFFGDVLGVHNPWLRGGLFAFLEIALLVSAIRARRNLLDDLAYIAATITTAKDAVKAAVTDEDRAAATKRLAEATAQRASTGVDGTAVWVLATLSGAFSALDARSFAEASFRLAAPLVAAWLWERGLAAHRRRHRRGSRPNSRLTAERVLVALRLADPTGRTVSDLDRSRRLVKLARVGYRMHMLRIAGARKGRVAAATRRYHRHIHAANKHLNLASDQAVRDELRMHLAVLYQSVAGTAPAAVTGLAPWGVDTPSLGVTDTPGAVPPASLSVASGTADGTPRETPAAPLTEPVPQGSDTPGSTPAETVPAPLPGTPVNGSETGVRNPPARRITRVIGTPAPRSGSTGTGTPEPPVTSIGTPGGTGTDTPADADLLTVLRDSSRVPREGDGTVPIKRAMRVLGTGRDRAIRLLKTAELLREPVTDEGADTPGETGSGTPGDDDPERAQNRVNGHTFDLTGAPS